MVRRGEYLERAVVIGGARGAIEGLYHRGSKRPGLLIAPMHPFKEGSMESPIIAELAWAVTRAGHPTLRFNYRGVGASPGRFQGVEDAEVDLLDAAEHLARCLVAPAAVESGDAPFLDPASATGLDVPRAVPDLGDPETGGATLALAGVGFGARVAVRALRTLRRVETLILVMPDPSDLSELSVPRGVEVVVVVAEREDAEKRRALVEKVSALPQGRLAVIPGADRSFLRGLVELGRVVQDAVSPPGLLVLD